MTELTLIISVYNQPLMIARQMEEISKYPDGIKVIVVDDASKEMPEVLDRVDLYRIEIDVQWNRGQARNIGAYVCETEWLIQVDTDHILPAECIEPLLAFEADPMHWYRFPRFRVGRADETRKKDKLHHMKKFGRIHEHIDSYLMRVGKFQMRCDVFGQHETSPPCRLGRSVNLRRPLSPKNRSEADSDASESPTLFR